MTLLLKWVGALGVRQQLHCIHVLIEPADDWTGEHGYITRKVLQRHLPKNAVMLQCFICGPTPMIRPQVLKEGTTHKFVKEVEHRTFSGREARRRGQRVLYVTERCVFQLIGDGQHACLGLIEIAPGIELERDVLAQRDFMPTVSA